MGEFGAKPGGEFAPGKRGGQQGQGSPVNPLKEKQMTMPESAEIKVTYVVPNDGESFLKLDSLNMETKGLKDWLIHSGISSSPVDF